MYLKDSNSPQHETNCSPALCVSVDERQRSWCPGSSPPQVHVVAAAGLGLVRVMCEAAAVPCQLPPIRARRCGGIRLKLSPHAIYECGVLYFFPKRLLILEGKKFRTPHFRLLCIASIRQSLLSCCFVFLWLFLALVKGQGIFCLRISKWISQCISACYHMADKPLQSILKLSWLKHRLHPLHASGTFLFSEI